MKFYRFLISEFQMTTCFLYETKNIIVQQLKLQLFKKFRNDWVTVVICLR